MTEANRCAVKFPPYRIRVPEFIERRGALMEWKFQERPHAGIVVFRVVYLRGQNGERFLFGHARRIDL